MKNILITGLRGFIGFNAIQYWTKTYPELTFVGLDGETYADKFMKDQKDAWLKDHDIRRYIYDISRGSIEAYLSLIIEQQGIDTIVNFAAESHVDNSIKDPSAFFRTNVIGTASLLNVARNYNLRFHQIGTDEVYGETTPDDWQYRSICQDWSGYYSADYKPLKPSSPYSSSKAAADMITLSYHRTYGTNVTVSRCTNNFGPWQHTEKLIPTVISKALKNEKIPVYGEGLQKRHWINVDEHNRLIMKILSDGQPGMIYNIAPPEKSWLTNIQLIKFILNALGKPESLIEHVTDRLGHDSSYFLYGTDFCQSQRPWEADMLKTIEWYKENLA